jgi:hypothetical protein
MRPLALCRSRCCHSKHFCNSSKPGFQQLEAESIEQDGGLVYKSPRATLSKLRQDVPDIYPVIGEPKFFDAGLHKTHDVFKWNDYHYTEGMDYKPPPVLQHSEASLTDAVKRHECDLVSIQGYLVQSTRVFDTVAFEIVEMDFFFSNFIVLLAGIRLATINGGYEKAKNIQVVVLGYDLMDFLDDVVGNVVPGLCYSVVIEGIIGILYA